MLGITFISSSTVFAQMPSSGILPQLGTIQQQDINNIKNLEQEKREMRDYRNHQTGQEQKA